MLMDSSCRCVFPAGFNPISFRSSRTQLLIDKVGTWMDSDNKSVVVLFKNANVRNIDEFKKRMK